MRLVALTVALLPSLLGFGRNTVFHGRVAAHHRGWIAFSRVQDGYYGAGKRTYVAHLSQPAGSHVLTLILVHTQARYNGGASGVLLHTVIRISNASARTLRGHLNFSSVYRRAAPAGAPPFGTYTARIYRGTARGQLLAQGSFVVIED